MRIKMQTSQSEMTLQKAFEEFITEKRVLKLAAETLHSYKVCFDAFTNVFPADNQCSDITPALMLEFVLYLQTRNPNIKPISVNSYLRHIRAMVYSFMEKGYMPTFRVKMLRCEKEIIPTYTEAELERLLKKPDKKTCDFPTFRNWVMVCYLLGTGNRLDTVSNLKIQDINFENHEIALKKVKSKKAYTIPISSTLEKTLIEYLRVRKGQPDDYLFCNQFGERLQKESVKTAIRRYNNERGVARTSIHLFRHTFAKNWILNRGDPFRLKSILGHSTMAMVNEYVNMFGKDLHRDFDMFNPLESMKGYIGEKTAMKMR